MSDAAMDELTRRRLRAVARAMAAASTGCYLDRDDYFQEAALALLKAPGGVGSMSPNLVRTVARNAMRDARRSDIRQDAAVAGKTLYDTFPHSRPALGPDESLELRLVVQALEPTDAALARLHLMEGRSLEEAGRAVGLTRWAARRRVLRIREQLRAALGVEWAEQYGRPVPLRNRSRYYESTRRARKPRKPRPPRPNKDRAAPCTMRDGLERKLDLIQRANAVLCDS